MTFEDLQLQPSAEELYLRAQPHSIDDYASNYKDGLEFAHSYPGDRPETSFLVDSSGLMENGPMVYPMIASVDKDGRLIVEVKTDGGNKDLDHLLEGLSLPKMKDRIPILAYGANVAPAAAQKKYGVGGRPEIGFVPTLYAQLPGHEVVWFQNPGQKGNAIAALYLSLIHI